MTGYMPTVGSMGLDMMYRTCTVQVRVFDAVDRAGLKRGAREGGVGGYPTGKGPGSLPRRSLDGAGVVGWLFALQVNLDFDSEKDMVEKFRIGLALQPLANALFACSPFKEGKPSGCVRHLEGGGKLNTGPGVSTCHMCPAPRRGKAARPSNPPC